MAPYATTALERPEDTTTLTQRLVQLTREAVQLPEWRAEIAAIAELLHTGTVTQEWLLAAITEFHFYSTELLETNSRAVKQEYGHMLFKIWQNLQRLVAGRTVELRVTLTQLPPKNDRALDYWREACGDLATSVVENALRSVEYLLLRGLFDKHQWSYVMPRALANAIESTATRYRLDGPLVLGYLLARDGRFESEGALVYAVAALTQAVVQSTEEANSQIANDKHPDITRLSFFWSLLKGMAFYGAQRLGSTFIEQMVTDTETLGEMCQALTRAESIIRRHGFYGVDWTPMSSDLGGKISTISVFRLLMQLQANVRFHTLLAA